ncbi:uncharacterized protein PHALS_02154 [Plasmopara halstedii]|uniref:Uncharacterized protein n=1 Tax=Plasmopara halstedii TaxID=4781 RepID=A0A0P1AXR5_PLAHL|nr:uncharacterized protein PHALS_02154 [Plasmopara halstedii]CEG45881.1 hypothetical protein PHALS_02154 [Plasmopara halstedii]|eukprot:XP_024582250.1 hypothetical protein PHALS_02154 [Plasmopara halstedii]
MQDGTISALPRRLQAVLQTIFGLTSEAINRRCTHIGLLFDISTVRRARVNLDDDIGTSEDFSEETEDRIDQAVNK